MSTSSHSEYVEKPVKPFIESLNDEEHTEEFSDTPQGRKALEKWARLNDESQGC
jgi:hypothetical protein